MIKYVLFVLVILLQSSVFANTERCDYKDNKDLKKYKIRIDGFIEKNSNIVTCEILDGYNKILDNEELMNKFEENPSNFQEFSQFIGKFPKIGQFISTYEDFENFNKISSKDIIEKVLDKTNLRADKKGHLVFLMALSFQTKAVLDEKSFEKDLKEINKYSEEYINIITPFWNVYINVYSESNHMKNLDKFLEIINEIKISTLKDYSNREEFFQYFLSDKNSLEYTKTIKKLLDKSEVKEKYLLSFIQQISSDIEDAINSGLKENDVVLYLKPFISDKVLMESFYQSACSKTQEENSEDIPESAIITQSLKNKISFKKVNEEIFNDIMKSLKNENKESEKIIILSYYNFMVRIYDELENKKQKEILIDLYKNLTKDKVFNMRAITILYQYTSYFSDIINDNWKNKEYRDILYIEQSGNTPLKYLKDNNPNSMEQSIKELNEMLYSLIRTPKDNLKDLTLKEIANNTVDAIDTASTVTLIIPGVGIGVNAAKVLAKQSIKAILKQGAKKIAEKSYNGAKNVISEYLEYRINYGDGRRKFSRNINNSIKNIDESAILKVSMGYLIGKFTYTMYNYYFEEKEQKSICGEEN